MSFIRPIPGGTIGRTDQGVDISAPGGSPALDPVPGQSSFVGTISNWYNGQPFYWFKVLTGPFAGRFWYMAEQVRSGYQKGQTVAQGGRVGTIAKSGTGTEWGWATASGQTLARATTGYTEGQTTPAGSDFASRVSGGRASAGMTASWKPCTLTWYDPALGGINTTGAANPHAKMANGQPYNAGAMTCAAPSNYPFGTSITFKYNGKQVTCTVTDRGGAIVGSHFDLSRGAAQALGIINAGMVNAQFITGPGYNSSPGQQVRPGGSADTGAAVNQLFADYYALRDAPRQAPPQQSRPQSVGAAISSVSSSFQWWASQFQDALKRVYGA